MSVSDILGAQAAPLTLKHNGRFYRAKPLTQQGKTRFERWLAQSVLDALAGASGGDPARYEQMVGIVTDRIALGYYSFHGELALRAMKTPAGVLALACILFDTPEDEMLGLLAERGAEVGRITALAFRQSFPQLPEPEPAPDEEEDGAEANPPTEASAAATPTPV